MKQLNYISSLAIALSLLALSGCATQSETMMSQGYPAGYADGFEDGCHSGKQAGGSYFDQFKKDVRRFNSDRDYAQGWSDAFRQCETQEEALERQTRMSMEYQRLDDERRDHMAYDALEGIDTSGLGNLK